MIRGKITFDGLPELDTVVNVKNGDFIFETGKFQPVLTLNIPITENRAEEIVRMLRNLEGES